MKPFTAETIKIIKQIPAGYVMTYGQVAEYAGSKRGARQVARILHSMSKKYELPWHRVVNRSGEIVIQAEAGAITQRYMLEDEGIEVDANGRVDLKKYQYKREKRHGGDE